MVAPQNETMLPMLLSKYNLKEIFKTDEFGLLYQCLPNKTYFKGQKCSGGKSSKGRLSGMAAGNAIGENFLCLQSASPRPLADLST